MYHTRLLYIICVDTCIRTTKVKLQYMYNEEWTKQFKYHDRQIISNKSKNLITVLKIELIRLADN